MMPITRLRPSSTDCIILLFAFHSPRISVYDPPNGTRVELALTRPSHYNRRTMRKPRKKSLELHRTLTGGMPGLEPFLGGALANAAAVCLDKNSHVSGVELEVSGQYRRRVEVCWDGPTDQVRNSYADLHEATEFGAAGVAIAALNNFGGWIVMQRSRKRYGL